MQTRVQGLSEDWLSVWIGLGIFVLALAVIGGADLLGWVVTTQVWADLSRALGTATKAYAGLGGLVAGSGAARALREDRHRAARRLPRRHGGREARARHPPHVPRPCGDHRRLPHLLVRGVLRRACLVRLQPRMGRAARLRHLGVRC